MFGQKMWFTQFHPVKDITLVFERYGNETKRIVSATEAYLVKQRNRRAGNDRRVWLVGNKCTYADLAFVTWDILPLILLFPAGFDSKTEFHLFCQWHECVMDRPAVKKVLDMREHCIAPMEDTARAVLPNRKP
jgi:glutathione S-transferase